MLLVVRKFAEATTVEKATYTARAPLASTAADKSSRNINYSKTLKGPTTMVSGVRLETMTPTKDQCIYNMHWVR